MAATTIAKFTSDIQAFAEKIGVAKKIVVQKIALDLWKSITKRTPVDTGRARANWMLSVGAPSGVVVHENAVGKESVPEPDTPDVSAITGEESVFIVNNLPYIGALEDGHSAQAPSGMVQLAIQEVAASIGATVQEAVAAPPWYQVK